MNNEEDHTKNEKLFVEYKSVNSDDIDNINNYNQVKIESELEIDKKPNKSKFQRIIIAIKDCINKLLLGCFYCLFATSVFLYILSLEGCKKNNLDECLVDDQIDNYVMAGIKLLICCAIVSIVILLQLLLKLTKVNYIIFIIPYAILFHNFKGVDLQNHGTYNTIAFLFFTPSITLYFYIIYYMFYSFFTKKFIRGSIILFLFTLKFFIYFYYSTCENFYKGLNGFDIENNKATDKCYMIRPNKCSMKFIDPFFDASNLKGGCKGKWNTKKRFLKYLKKSYEEIDHFYYPRIEFSPKKDTYTDNIFNYVYNNIGGVKENPKEAEKAEVFLDFTNDEGKITIKLKKNETLIKERRILAEKNEVKFDNVYIFYIDALSRNHFLKRMKKIKGVLEEMLYSKQVQNKNNNEKGDERYKRYNSFQFIKYQNMPGTTSPNMFPLFYGVPLGDNTGISLTKFFKEKGFITANTINSCYRDLFHIGLWAFMNKTIENFDHENLPMFCDTNFLEPQMIWAYQQGENAIFRKCIYGRDSYEYMFEYMTQFLEAYKDERKYMRICFSDAHEATQHLVKHIDEPLYNFLNLILDKYSDDNTAIIFLSDHGGKLPGPYAVLFVEEWKFESELSSLFLILPVNNTKYDKNIILNNEKRYLSSYDFYSTLLDYLNVNKSEIKEIRQEYGQSLLTPIDGMKRDCESVGIKDCYCHNYE